MTIGDTTSASSAPQLKMTPLSSEKGVALDIDRQGSKQSPLKASPLKPPLDTISEKSQSTNDDSSNATQEGKTLPLDALEKSERVVSFNKRVRIRKIKQLDDMPPDQIEATYFSDQELMDIRNGLRIEIRALVEHNFNEEEHEDSIDDDTTFCIRGLEHEFPRGKYKRKQLKMMSRGAVMEEQRLQREFFVHNERSESTHSYESTSTVSTFSYAHEDPSLAIADVYRIESKPAVQLALEYARRDEFVADQIYFAHQAV